MATPLERLRQSIRNYLQLNDSDLGFVDFVVCICLANLYDTPSLPGHVPGSVAGAEPVFGWGVGPPSSCKSEILLALSDWQHFYRLDEITEHGMSSGAKREDGSDPSALPQWNGKIVVIHEFSTFISGNQERVASILAQFRSAFSGAYFKQSGKEGRIEHKAKFGVLAGMTDSVDEYLQDDQRLGQRSLIYRMSGREENPAWEDRHAWENSLRILASKGRLRREVRALFADLLTHGAERLSRVGLPTIHEITTPEQFEVLWSQHYLLAVLRSTPLYSKRHRRYGSPVAPERSARVGLQISLLLAVRAILDDRTHLDEGDIRFSRRIVEDTLPRHTLALVRYLLQHYPDLEPLSHVVEGAGLDRGLTRALLLQYERSRIVQRKQVNKTWNYTLTAEAHQIIQKAGLFGACT